MAEHKPNREYKASLFTSLFGEPAKMLELYNAISGAHYPSDTRIEDATLDDVLFMDRINDLAFVVDNKVVILVEHQSTINENMPLRFLIYLGRVLEKIIDNKLFYRYARVNIPAPEFIILYNGENDLPDQMVLKLSDAFGAVPELCGRYPMELEVKVYNVNKGRNAVLVKRSKTLDGYVIFIDKVKKFTVAGAERTKAISMAIRESIEEGVLADYLKSHGSEVHNMLFQEWNLEEALDVRFMEGRDEGKVEGKVEGNTETARRMLSMGFSVGDIAMCTGLSLEKIKSLNPLHP